MLRKEIWVSEGALGWLIASALLVGACSNTESDPEPPAVEVEPTYAEFSNWNRYLKSGNPLAACDGSEADGYAACIHGGEHRRVELTGVTSCDGLSLQENLGAFEWTCDDREGAGPVVFSTTGLAAERGLKTLVHARGFRPNAVVIRRDSDRAVVARSAPAVWGWTNAVQPLPPAEKAALVLRTLGTVYTIDETRHESGYNIDADGTAIVALHGAVLGWNGASEANCDTETGEASTPDQRCLLAAGSQSFVWVEVSLDGAGDGGGESIERGLFLSTVSLSRIHQTTVVNTSADGVDLPAESHNNAVTGLTIRSSGADGMRLGGDRNLVRDLWVEDVSESALLLSAGSDENLLINITALRGEQEGVSALVSLHGNNNRGYNLSIHKSGQHGLMLVGSRNVIVNAVLTNHRYSGFRIWDDVTIKDNVLVGILAAHNGVNGGYLHAGQGHTISHVTAANNGQNGVQMGVAGRVNRKATVNQLLAVNNGEYGITVVGASGSNEHLFSRVVTAHNHPGNLIIRTGNNHRFAEDLWVSELASNCRVDSTDAAPGLIDGTCTDDGKDGSNIYSDQKSTATLHVGVDVTSSFVGKVTSDDTTNADDVAGEGAAASIGDYANFDNRWRAWGREGPAFPDAANAGRCDSGTCRIWDWRLRASDTVLRNINGAFEPSQACPASVNGDQTLTDQQDPPHTFLLNAVEIVLDGVGNDNGLCESDETCLYAPNIGCYMGEGELASEPCLFEDGRVSGVTMRGYASNGG